ncbi:MAG TPA: trypsin-like peptidase domain-containing protein [Ignavibacteria bacterium]|nr:trypsin-like peptidase domain-containing protein [Ignavibacteria bacterium]HQY52542.1 trypsin-like peptidase domain-containing protein [Ignavibacteria bacterium]HRB01511.1 trypsin-like peptidase domain-containing protein [Ignavibacteria bacterium]
MNNNLISDTVNIQNNKNYRSVNTTGKILLAILTVLILTSGVLIGKYFLSPGGNENTIVNSTQNSLQENNNNISETRETAITRAVKKVSPTIVGINVEEVREVQDPFSMFDNDPFFKQFFGNRQPQKRVVRGLGSGYIISSDGYILTNDHVAGNATKISVTMTNGETIDARLIGSDKNSDVALLKIDKNNLPFATLGNSNDVIIGEWVIALGNPFGLFDINDQPTVTVGVVSATDMKISTGEGNRVYKEMIQTDASINSGNSGGPLLNADGEVIGMNTIIYTGGQYSGGSIGVGFAISINRVKKIMEEIKEFGVIDRNFNVGFRIQQIDERIAKYLNLSSTEGVVVTDVLKGGLSDKAGLQSEDVIIEANGEKVKNDQDILFIVNDLKKGENLKLKIIRKGSEKDIDFKLE